ncbi:hypothetical protein ABLN79_15250, partial [Mycobacterium tuberculosis]
LRSVIVGCLTSVRIYFDPDFRIYRETLFAFFVRRFTELVGSRPTTVAQAARAARHLSWSIAIFQQFS